MIAVLTSVVVNVVSIVIVTYIYDKWFKRQQARYQSTYPPDG